MRLILIILLTFPLITISCIDKEFEKELNFVQSLIENPENIESIVKGSQYYDSLYFVNECGDFPSISKYLRHENKPEIVNYGYANAEYKDNIRYDSTKSIIVKFGGKNYLIMSINFKKINGKETLLTIGVGY